MDDITIAVSVIYSLFIFGFTITFFVLWYRKKEELKAFKSYGYAMGAVLIVLEIISFSFLLVNAHSPSFLTILITDIFAFFRLTAFTILGIYFCMQMDIPSLPFVINKYGWHKSFFVEQNLKVANNSMEESLPTKQELPIANELTLLENNSAELETIAKTTHMPDFPLPSSKNEMIVAALITATAGILFSIVLFWLTSPKMSQLAQEQFGGSDLTLSNIPLALSAFLTFAFAEELVFRLGIQNFLAKQFNWQGHKYWLAILITTSLWTLGHVGVLEPGWVKMVQIFPVGIGFGWLFKRYGVESTIIAHSLFNVVLMIPANYLIS
jgi:hypothetical protein